MPTHRARSIPAIHRLSKTIFASLTAATLIGTAATPRPALAGDGGYLEILGLKEHTLSIRYQGACGSCPSSLTGTLMAIEGMLKQEVDPDLEVIAV